MRLSLLDRSRTRAGHPESDGLVHSVERAAQVERAGYHRFWVAEHHAVPGIASGAPAVLLAAIGARTAAIRLGSGGVMLPNHQPLVVAEQFLMLEALFPDRIDLGVGRSLGFTGPVRDALGRTEADADSFAGEIHALRAFLQGEAEVTARPAAGAQIPMFVLATGSGLEIAAQLGLPVVIGGPALDRAEISARLADYRRTFRPHRGSAPSVIVSLDILIADTAEQARELALPESWAMVRSRSTGLFEPLEAPEQIRDRRLSGREEERLHQSLDAACAGTATTVRRRLEQLIDRTGADEILSSASTFDREALADSDRLLATLLGSSPPAA